MEVHQRPENNKYYTHWRLHLHILLNTTKKGFTKQNINTNNKYFVDQLVKNAYESVDRVAWERGCIKRITLCMLCRKLHAIM